MAAMIRRQGISNTNNILSNPGLVTVGIGKCQSRASLRPIDAIEAGSRHLHEAQARPAVCRYREHNAEIY